MQVPDPRPAGFAEVFSALVDASGRDLWALAVASRVGRATISDWRTGRSLPQSDDQLLAVVGVCCAVIGDLSTDAVWPRTDQGWRSLLAAAKQARESQAVPARRASEPAMASVAAPVPVASSGGELRADRVPSRNPFFVGRDELLADIHRRLHSADATSLVVGVVPLRGMAGSASLSWRWSTPTGMPTTMGWCGGSGSTTRRPRSPASWTWHAKLM